MTLDTFDETMKTLMAEYESSGMSIDEFIEQKLKANGRADAAEVVKDINATLAGIDEKYASLQKFKDEGHNREEWLRQEMDDATKTVPTDKAGQFLSSATKVLNGEDNDAPDEDANYDAFDAAMTIRELDDALVKNTCASLTPGEAE